MTTMIAEVYDALVEAGASAEAVAGFENRFAKVQTDLAVLKAMVATNLVLMLAGFEWVLQKLPH